MKSLYSLSVRAFLTLNKFLILTNILTLVLLFVFVWYSFHFWFEHIEFSKLLNYKFRRFLVISFLFQAAIMFIIALCSLAIKVVLHSRCYLTNCNARFYALLLTVGIVVSFLGVPLALSTLAIDALDKGGEEGFKSALSKYRTDLGQKKLLDRVQIKYKCCGIASFRDWIKSGWYVGAGIPSTDKHDFEHVPFSCCADTTRTPCIHHWIFSSRHHYNPQPMEQQLWPTGCAHVAGRVWASGLSNLRLQGLLNAVLGSLQLLAERMLMICEGRLASYGNPRPRESARMSVS